MAIVQLFSAFLGYAIVCGSAIVKFPQLLSIVRSKNADGVSLLAHILETTIYGVALSWGVAKGLDVSTYGETIPVFLQLLVLNVAIGLYTKQLVPALAGVAFLVVLTALLAIGALPAELHQLLYSAQILLIISSKLPQILLTYKKKATGALSFTTVFLTFGGASARVLTTLVGVSWEQGKLVMLAGFGVAALMNGIMFLQFFLYGGAPFGFKPLSKHAAKRDEDAKKGDAKAARKEK